MNFRGVTHRKSMQYAACFALAAAAVFTVTHALAIAVLHATDAAVASALRGTAAHDVGAITIADRLLGLHPDEIDEQPE